MDSGSRVRLGEDADHVLHAVNARPYARVIVVLAISLASLVAGFVYVISVTTGPKAESRPSLAAFERQQVPEDRIGSPDYPEIDHRTTRLLGEDDGATLFAALDSRGEVCLLARLRSDEEIWAKSCGTLERFESSGIGLRVESLEAASETYLVPDDVVLGALEGSAFTRRGENLVSKDPFRRVSSSDTMLREHDVRGGTFALTPLDEPPGRAGGRG